MILPSPPPPPPPPWQIIGLLLAAKNKYTCQEPRLQSRALFRHVTESLRQTVAIFVILSMNIAFILSSDDDHVRNLIFFLII